MENQGKVGGGHETNYFSGKKTEKLSFKDAGSEEPPV
jgi:hypothetical protein